MSLFPQKRILVIQLMRLGDNIQTVPLLRQLRHGHPQASIELLVLDRMVAFWQGFESVDRVHSLAASELLAFEDEDLAEAHDDAALRLREWAASLGEFEHVHNLTQSQAAAYLCREIRATRRFGGVWVQAGTRTFEDFWTRYMVAMIGFRSRNQVNIVDMFRGNLGPCKAAYPSLWMRTSALQFNLPEKPFVALCPGASAANRQWPPEHFGRLAGALHDLGFAVVVVGTAAERILGRRLRRAAQQAQPLLLCGKTNLFELAEVLRRAHFVVSNDTGTLHVAAAVGTSVLGLFGSTAQVQATGPWLEGALAIQAPLGESMTAIDVTAVLTGFRMGLGDVIQEPVDLKRNRLELLRAEFLDLDQDPLGGVYWYPAWPKKPNQEMLENQALRLAFTRTWAGIPLDAAFEMPDWLLPWVGQMPRFTAAQMMGVRSYAASARAMADADGSANAQDAKQFMEGLEPLDSTWSDLKPLSIFLKWNLKFDSYHPECSGGIRRTLQQHHVLAAHYARCLAQLDRSLF